MEPPNMGHSQAPQGPPWSKGLNLHTQTAASPFDYVKAGAAVSRTSCDQFIFWICNFRQQTEPKL